ncbi:MAG: alpha-L-rhamnosidase N-terminal domain-containing protein, partial [Armatimonadetes bacterium]|nr:alpha-L-rhamnosidase N-terminal domain-containing protein [Armatimonadota bacterium]
MEWQGQWLWTAAPLRNRNRFVRFRRRFDYRGGAARLHLTADSRYALYVNGEYLGRGPVRAWPHHARYDTYDLQPHLRPGLNVVAVLVQHLGESTFQYLDGPPGLLAQLELADEVLASDSRWRAAPDASFVGNVPRISCQLGFEEQVDARLDDNWVAPDYDDTAWPSATELRPAADGHHNHLAPRGIPHLTHEPLLPQRIVSLETVRSQPLRATVYLKPYLFPADRSANMMLVHAYLATIIESPAEATVRLVSPHQGARAWRLNGQLMTDGRGTLKRGSN